MTKDAVSGRTRSKLRMNEMKNVFLKDLKKKDVAKELIRISKQPKKIGKVACIEEKRFVQWRKKRPEVAVVEVQTTPVQNKEVQSFISPSY